MYSDYDACAVCGSEVRLRPHPGASGEDGSTGAPAGPADGVVGGGDPTVDLRVCTNEDCPSRRPGGPEA